MEFSEPQWARLRARAHELGLSFISSPFSVEAADLLIRVGVDAWKIASGEVRNRDLLDRIAKAGLEVFLSTGMSDFAEIGDAVASLREHELDVTVLQCTSQYPTPPERLGLNVMDELRARFPDCRVGLSDHSGTTYAGLAAAALGADAVEVHVCFSREGFGPDIPASVTIEELGTLAEGIRFVERARSHPVDKDAVAQEMAPMRRLFMKSVVAGVDLPAGKLLSEGDLRAKKPGTGIPAEALPTLVGRRLANPVQRDQLLSYEDLEE
jgi:N,N'-diacetyllegionaminate synthase